MCTADRAHPEGEGVHSQAVRMRPLYEPPAWHPCTHLASFVDPNPWSIHIGNPLDALSDRPSARRCTCKTTWRRTLPLQTNGKFRYEEGRNDCISNHITTW